MGAKIVKDTDRKFIKFKRIMRDLSKVNAKAGWLKSDSKSNRDDGLKNYDIANILINGSIARGLPPRDFLGNARRDNAKKYKKLLQGKLWEIMNKYTPKNSDKATQKWKRHLKKLALEAKKDLQLELKDKTGRYAPNKPSTIKAWQLRTKSRRRKKKKLFVDTGQLINSITTRVK